MTLDFDTAVTVSLLFAALTVLGFAAEAVVRAALESETDDV